MRPSKDNNNIRELKQAGMLTRLIYIMMKKGTSNFIIKEVYSPRAPQSLLRIATFPISLGRGRESATTDRRFDEELRKGNATSIDGL